MVASWKARGMHAGVLVICKRVEGPQRWRVKVATQRPDGQRDEHVIRSAEPIPLSAMRDLVISSIHELTQPGALADASMSFHLER